MSSGSLPWRCEEKQRSERVEDDGEGHVEEEDEAAEDDGWCGVCGSTHSEEGDALVFCDGENCQVAVHQLCYGVNELPPENEPWLCEPCCEKANRMKRRVTLGPREPVSGSCDNVDTGPMQEGAATSNQDCDSALSMLTNESAAGKVVVETAGNAHDELGARICIICHRPGHPALAMKRATLYDREQALRLDPELRGPGTPIDAWAHVTCALWIPQVSFVDHDKLQVAIAGDLIKERGTLRCELCNTRGQCVQCSRKRCVAAFHPVCILRELLGPRQWSDSKSSWRKGWSDGIGEVLCAKHYEGARRAKASKRRKGPKASPALTAGPPVVVQKCEYEIEREARIARNTSFLASLGLANDQPSLGSSTKRKRRDAEPLQLKPMRRSPRERTKSVNYAEQMHGGRRTPEELAKAKAEVQAKRLKKVLDAADRAVAQATIDDTRHHLRCLFRYRADAYHASAEARRHLDNLHRMRQYHEERRRAEIAFAQGRHFMEMQLAHQHQRNLFTAMQEAEQVRQMDAREAHNAWYVAQAAERELVHTQQRREEKRERERLRDIEKANKAVERAMQAEKQREEKRLEKVRKDDARAAAKAARDAEQAEQKRAQAAIREAFSEARARAKRIKQARPATLVPDMVASDAVIAELLLLEKDRAEKAGAQAGKGKRRIACPAASATAQHNEAITRAAALSADASQVELAQLSATILAEGHRLPPCCFCGGRADDPDSASGAFIQQMFLCHPSPEKPQGSLVRSHVRCARLSPTVTVDDHGVYYNVLAEAQRGAQTKCNSCGLLGATIPCQVGECSSTYHAACAVSTGWAFRGERRFWCPRHRDAPCTQDEYGERHLDASDNSRLSEVFLGSVSGRHCPSCQQYDPRSQGDYVGCDGCRTWWHPRCAGVDMAAVNAADVWYCPNCVDESRKLHETTLCICGVNSFECVNDQMLLCENCDIWHHPECVGLDSAEFSRLSASPEPWFCPKCCARDRVCKCQRPRKDGEMLVRCAQCELEFHPTCVALRESEAAEYFADENKTRLFFCPDCYVKVREERGRQREAAKRRKLQRPENTASQQDTQPQQSNQLNVLGFAEERTTVDTARSQQPLNSGSSEVAKIPVLDDTISLERNGAALPHALVASVPHDTELRVHDEASNDSALIHVDHALHSEARPLAPFYSSSAKANNAPRPRRRRKKSSSWSSSSYTTALLGNPSNLPLRHGYHLQSSLASGGDSGYLPRLKQPPGQASKPAHTLAPPVPMYEAPSSRPPRTLQQGNELGIQSGHTSASPTSIDISIGAPLPGPSGGYALDSPSTVPHSSTAHTLLAYNAIEPHNQPRMHVAYSLTTQGDVLPSAIDQCHPQSSMRQPQITTRRFSHNGAAALSPHPQRDAFL